MAENAGGSKQTLSIDYRIICLVLLAVIASMLVIWKPWDKTSVATRKVTVSGQSTIEAQPDEYTLYPYFERTNADRAKAQTELNELATQITTKAKEIGIEEGDITLNSDAYDQYRYYGLEPSTDSSVVTLRLDIKAKDKDKAQKMQDYLISLDPKGQISPVAGFSKEKQKNLEAEARTKAIDDAKSKAETSASQLGGKLGKVITISDSSAGNIPIFYGGVADQTVSAEAKLSSSLPVVQGDQEINYSVTVEYELK